MMLVGMLVVLTLGGTAGAAVRAYWTFDEVTPSASVAVDDVLADTSGNDRHLTVKGASLTAVAGATGGTALQFTGTQWAEAATEAGFHFGAADSFTVETKVLWAVANAGGPWGQGAGSSAQTQLEMHTDFGGSGGVRAVLYEGSPGNADAPVGNPFPTLGQWRHVAVVRDVSAGTVSLYVDGVRADSVPITTTGDVSLDVNNFTVGSTWSHGLLGARFNGLIDYVRISDVALAPAEFAELPVTGFWTFDEYSPGNTVPVSGVLADTSGHGRDLTVAGASLTAVAGAAGGTALQFTGTQWAEAATEAGFHFGAADSFTVETKVLWAVANAGGPWGQGAGSSAQTQLEMHTDFGGSGGVRAVLYEGSPGNADAPVGNPFPTLGQWRHVAVVRDVSAGTVSLYVDGVRADSVPITTTGDVSLDVNNFTVGSTWSHGLLGARFNGLIDYVRVSNAALTPAQFAELPVTGYWTFDEYVQSGTVPLSGVLADSSGHGRDLTVVGGALTAVVGEASDRTALQFNGAQYAEAALETGFHFGANRSFTVEFLGYWTIPNAGGPWAQGAGSSAQSHVEIHASFGGGVGAVLYDGIAADVPVAAGNPVALGQWQHVALVRDVGAGTVDLYVDRVLAGSAPITTTGDVSLDVNNFVIGNTTSYGLGVGFDGLLDYVRVTEAALTPGDFLPVQVAPPSVGTVVILQ